ncbi:hypothetical protein ONZ45_g2547 [Pleurotus djamor]|nr:hypothetical protein ONZ45_g2547 [Pleurotus djamor]
MLPGPLLPQEILDIIIHVLGDDVPTLKSCSLVDSAWRAASQKLLHQTIVLRTTVLLPRAGGGGMDSSAQSSALGSEKVCLLLDTSSHLLRHVRTLVIRGDRLVSPWRCGNFRPKRRAPDPSLVALLSKFNTLALPLLTSVELRHMTWTEVQPELQDVLILLLSQRFIKKVSLANCGIPSNVRWLKFVGPDVASINLDGLKILDVYNAERSASNDDNPMSSGPNLTHLEIGGLYHSSSGQVLKWLLEDSSTLPSSQNTVSPGRSWRESVTTLSLHCRTGLQGVAELFQTCSRLTTLKLDNHGFLSTIPLDDIMHIPTLNYLHFMPLPVVHIPWFLPFFKTINLPQLASSSLIPTQSKTIHLNMWMDSERTPISLPNLSIQIRALDEVAVNLYNVEVNLTLTMLTSRSKNDCQRIEYEAAKATLVGLCADLKALKFQVY